MNATGFPSPAQGYEEKPLDLNRMLVANQGSTYLMRYTGHALEEFGVYAGDILVVDCSLIPDLHKFVVVRTEDGFECRRIELVRVYKGRTFFCYDDGHGNCVPCRQIFGVVYSVLRIFGKQNDISC